MTDRAQQLRTFLRGRHPGARFLTEPPSGAGIAFGYVNGSEEMAPIVCSRYVAAMADHLNDEDWRFFLLGLDAYVGHFLEVADPDIANEDMEAHASARSFVLGLSPEAEAAMDRVFSV